MVFLSAPDRHAESSTQPQPGMGSDAPWNAPCPKPSLGMAPREMKAIFQDLVRRGLLA